jgi:hypothetical protein|tara:strand:- start:2337 stop:2567 length:231 start_codon:yes stop_codon:yes gene_type:complete
MTKKPRTTGEHIVALYGHITGLKKSIDNLKSNHIKHLHEDVEKINTKFDKLLFWIVGGVGTVALVFLTQILYILTK